MNLHQRSLPQLSACGSLAALALTLSIATPALADVVETKDGSRLTGTVKSITGGTIQLDTAYAGTIAVSQDEVVSLTVEQPIVVRLDSGAVLEGTISTTPGGDVTVASSSGQLTTSVTGIAATWAPGGRDPALAVYDRNWAYELSGDVSGKTGNSEQFGVAIGAKATLTTVQDKLQIYGAYNRQETDNEKSADQFRAGVDYQNNFKGKYSWYVRDEGGFDRVKDIDLYNVAAAGLGYDFIKNAPLQTLTGRTGLSFRYEGYGNPDTDDVKSAGLDFGLNHTYQFSHWRMVNTLSYVPAFEDFSRFRAVHDSSFEMPITASLWKLRIGVTNDYNSQPGEGVEKLDTIYYTRLILNFQ